MFENLVNIVPIKVGSEEIEKETPAEGSTPRSRIEDFFCIRRVIDQIAASWTLNTPSGSTWPQSDHFTKEQISLYKRLVKNNWRSIPFSPEFLMRFRKSGILYYDTGASIKNLGWSSAGRIDTSGSMVGYSSRGDSVLSSAQRKECSEHGWRLAVLRPSKYKEVLELRIYTPEKTEGNGKLANVRTLAYLHVVFFQFYKEMELLLTEKDVITSSTNEDAPIMVSHHAPWHARTTLRFYLLKEEKAKSIHQGKSKKL